MTLFPSTRGLNSQGRSRPANRLAVLGVALLAAFAQASSAATVFGLTILDQPDMAFRGTHAADNGLVYTAATQTMTVGGQVSKLFLPDGTEFDITNGTLTINVKVSSTGTLVAGQVGDHLVVTGDVTVGGTLYSGILLKGQALNYRAFDLGSTDVFRFAFTTTGGVLAPIYASRVYVPCTGENSTYAGSHGVDFHSDSKGNILGLVDTGTARVGDRVWKDTDQDGIQIWGLTPVPSPLAPLPQAGEEGFSNATVRLRGSNGALLATEATVGGYYIFDNLPPGAYYVEFVKPSGFTFSPEDAGISDALDSDADLTTGVTAGFNLVADQTDLTRDAGLYEALVGPSSLSGYVYEDSNNDGSRTGETGIAGVTVTLTGTDEQGNAVSLATTTDGNGFYQFTDLLPGTYTIAETQPAGYLDGKDTIGTPGGTAGNDQFSNIILAAGVDGVENNFGELRPSSLSGYVYEDSNDDGSRAGETGIAGVTVTLTGTDDLGNAVNLATTTDDNGFYQFTDLRPGTYTIAETQPAGYLDGKDTQGTPGNGVTNNDQFANIQLAAGVDGTENNFGELKRNDPQVTIRKAGAKLGGNTRTIGFWKTNIEKHLKGKKGTQVSKADLLAWLEAVQEFYWPDPFVLGSPSDPDGILEAAYKVLSYSGPKIAEKTKRQLLACELNLLSGTYALADVAAHMDLCMDAEDALKGLGGDLKTIHNLLDAVNNVGDSSSDPNIVVGDTIIFTITITSTLTEPTTIEVRDYLDSSLQVVFADNGGAHVSAGHFVRWPLALPAGTDKTTEVHLWVELTAPPANDAGQCPAGWTASDVVELPVGTAVLRNRACFEPPSSP